MAIRREGISLEEKLDGNVSSNYNPNITNITSFWSRGIDNDKYKIQYGKNWDPRDDTKIFEVLKGLGKIINY
jgi:hypothetical protein